MTFLCPAVGSTFRVVSCAVIVFTVLSNVSFLLVLVAEGTLNIFTTLWTFSLEYLQPCAMEVRQLRADIDHLSGVFVALSMIGTFYDRRKLVSRVQSFGTR